MTTLFFRIAAARAASNAGKSANGVVFSPPLANILYAFASLVEGFRRPDLSLSILKFSSHR